MREVASMSEWWCSSKEKEREVLWLHGLHMHIKHELSRQPSDLLRSGVPKLDLWRFGLHVGDHL